MAGPMEARAGATAAGAVIRATHPTEVTAAGAVIPDTYHMEVMEVMEVTAATAAWAFMETIDLMVTAAYSAAGTTEPPRLVITGSAAGVRTMDSSTIIALAGVPMGLTDRTEVTAPSSRRAVAAPAARVGWTAE